MNAPTYPHAEMKLLRFFPPPQFLRMPATGIDISDESVKSVHFSSTYKQIRTMRLGKVAIPAGTIVGGVVQDPEKASVALAELAQRYNISFGNVSLPSEHAYVFLMRVPGDLTPAETRNFIEFKLQENVPLSPEEAIFDYLPLSPASKKSGTQTEWVVSVTAYSKTLAQAYVLLCARAGLSVLSLEVEGQAAARALIREGDEGTYLLVDFGKSKAGLSVVKAGVIVYVATLDVGGDALDLALRKVFKVTALEAEHLKNERGFVRSSDNTKMFETLMSTVAALKDEVKKHFDYWNAHAALSGSRSIEQVILCGGNANLRGLPEYLRSAIGVPVTRGNVWTNVASFEDFIPTVSHAHSLELATSIGLALRTLAD